MLWHALLVWVVLPGCIALQAFVPALEPTCSHGYTNWSLFLLLALEIHHIWAEMRAWAGLRELVSPPELSVLRQLGVLASRRRCVLLGILEDADLYTDLAFPFIAWACDSEQNDLITTLWSRAWHQVPLVGHALANVVLRLRFWGIAMLVLVANVCVSGLWKIVNMILDGRAHRQQMPFVEQQQWRIHTRWFFNWAQAAETAMMPSVAVLSEELAAEQRWRWNKKGDAAMSTKAREDIYYGKTTEEALMTSETAVLDEEVNHSEHRHFNTVLIQKVLLGNVMALWLQSSFLALTFQHGMSQARIKLAISMIFSALQAAVRCYRVSTQTGVCGLCVSVVVMFFVAWSFVKVWKAYTCEDHLWNLTTGCVTAEEYDIIPRWSGQHNMGTR